MNECKPLFMGLLNDLFPKLLELVPRRRDMDFEAQITKSAVELGYQPEDIFVLKAGAYTRPLLTST